MFLWCDRIFLKQHGFHQYICLVKQVLNWIYKSFHLMRAEPKTSKTAGKQEHIIITQSSHSCEGNGGWSTMCSFSTGRNFAQKMIISIETSTTKREETLFPVSFHAEAQLIIKNQNYFFFSRKNSQNLITFHQATWEGAWEVSKLKQWGFYYFWWKALHTVLSFKCKWELDTNQIFFLF